VHELFLLIGAQADDVPHFHQKVLKAIAQNQHVLPGAASALLAVLKLGERTHKVDYHVDLVHH